MYITNPTHWAATRPAANCSTHSNPVRHTEWRPVRAPAQGRQREEQTNPLKKKKTKKTEGRNPRPTTNARPPEKRRGGRETVTQPRSRTPTPQDAANPPQPGNYKGDTHAAPRKKTGGPPFRTRRHPAKSSGPLRPHDRRRAGGKGTLDTPAHSPPQKWRATGHKKKRKQTQHKRKGKAGRKPRGPCPGQAAANTTEPRHDREPHTPPRSQKKKRRGGRNPAHGDPRTTTRHRQPQQGVAENRRATRKRAHAPTPQPEKQGVGKTQTNTYAPRTPDRNGGAQPKPVSKHTRPRPQPRVAGVPRNPTSNARSTKPSQKWRGKTKTRAQTHAP